MAIRITGIPTISPLDTTQATRQQPAAVQPEKSFGQFLTEALAQVEAAQTDATAAAQRLATGEIKDIAEVTIASEKATLALQLTVQVRNKVLEAYQEIMRMPV